MPQVDELLHRLARRASLQVAVPVFGILFLLTVALVLFGDAAASVVIPALGLAFFAVLVTQTILLIRFKWRLEGLMPEVLERRGVRSLWFGHNSQRLLATTQDPQVLGDERLRPLALAIAGLYGGQMAWFVLVMLAILSVMLVTMLRTGNFAALLALLLLLLVGGLLAWPSIKALRGH